MPGMQTQPMQQLKMWLTKRRSVDSVSVSLVGGSVSDEGGNLDEGGLVCHLLGLLDGVTDAVQVGVTVLQRPTDIVIDQNCMLKTMTSDKHTCVSWPPQQHYQCCPGQCKYPVRARGEVSDQSPEFLLVSALHAARCDQTEAHAHCWLVTMISSMALGVGWMPRSLTVNGIL